MVQWIPPRQVTTIRTTIEKDLKEPQPKEYNNLHSGEEESPLQIIDDNKLLNEDLVAEDVKLERPKAENAEVDSNQSRVSPMDGKDFSNEGMVLVEVGKEILPPNYTKRAILEKVDQIKDIIKAPPIVNPRREGERYPNDNLSDEEYERLFEKHVDYKLKDINPSARVVQIYADNLKMSKDKFIEKLKQFYTPEMGYPKIESGSLDSVLIYLE